MVASPAAGPSGVLVVDKPRGPTSFDIVAGVRRLYGTRSVGHAGTLDPMATGVLVVLLGEATKLSSYLTAADKSYLATVSFGVTTDTLDADGTPLRSHALPSGFPEPDALEQALHLEMQRTRQQPPVFSAIKVRGRTAHSLARSGKAPKLPERPVRVHRLDVLGLGTGQLQVRLDVSKGYYVRAFARDIANQLGVAGHLAQLRRIRSGCFAVHEAQAWPLQRPQPLGPLAQAAARALPWVHLTDDGVLRARHGKRLTEEHFSEPAPPGVCAWLSPKDHLVALGEPGSEGFTVRRGFNSSTLS